MAAVANHLEALVAGLEGVPPAVRQKLWELRQLHEEVVARDIAIEERQAALREAAVRMIEKERVKPILHGLFDEAELAGVRAERAQIIEVQQKKVKLTVEIYDALDRCCELVDGEIRDLSVVLPDFAKAAEAASGKRKKAGAAAAGAAADDHGNAAQTPGGGAQPAAAGLVPVTALKVDKNEPTYCYCGQVSYGSMVGCDNDDCPYEWFHLGCLGLKEEPPEGAEWFCPDCRTKLGKDKDGG